MHSLGMIQSLYLIYHSFSHVCHHVNHFCSSSKQMRTADYNVRNLDFHRYSKTARLTMAPFHRNHGHRRYPVLIILPLIQSKNSGMRRFNLFGQIVAMMFSKRTCLRVGIISEVTALRRATACAKRVMLNSCCGYRRCRKVLSPMRDCDKFQNTFTFFIQPQ